MRFLLQGRKLPVQAIRANTPLPTATGTTNIKAFGQQCSPHCGCVLRFEASVDDNGKIQAATYYAKQVLRSKDPSNPSLLQPTYTYSREPKLLFTECTCPSLNQLAKQVVAQLPLQRSTSILNQVEFSQVRSSLAFAHAVLTKFNLPPQKTHCLDLVEDALTAMIKQCLPAPLSRRSNFPHFTAWLHHQHERMLEQAEEEEFVERFGRALRRVRKPRNVYGKDTNHAFAIPRSMSALTMLDLVHQQEQDEYHDAFTKQIIPSSTRKENMMDWESYVDQMQYDHSSQASG